jgi:hypothetical protein
MEASYNRFESDFEDAVPPRHLKRSSDQHVVKMILESAQILCTALNKKGFSTPYKLINLGSEGRRVSFIDEYN